MIEEFVFEKQGKKFIRIENILPEFTVLGRPIVKENNGEKLIVYTPHPGQRKGLGSKKIILPTEVELRARIV